MQDVSYIEDCDALLMTTDETFNLDVFKSLLIKMTKHPKYRPTINRIFDSRSTMTMLDVPAIEQCLSFVDEHLSLANSQYKFAIIVDDSLEKQFVELYKTIRGRRQTGKTSLKSFDNLVSACSWIKAD